MDKEKQKKYKENLKNIGHETLEDLEPVVKKGFSNFIDFTKEVFNDFISGLFESRRQKRSKNENPKI